MSDALFLEILGSASRTAELPRQGKLIIGSSKDRASLVIDGQGVADVHCAIGRLKSGGWALKDLGSEFGTLVNGERVETTRLKDGDEILVGSQRLRVASAERMATPASKPKDAEVETAKPKAAEAEKAHSERPSRVPASKPARKGNLEIGGYRIERELGSGAMGIVVLATQTSLDRKVALKLLKGSLAKDAIFVERFRTEARAAARLNHPNIVTVFDVGEESGNHYLSMEYMDGGSVETQLESAGRIPWRDALGILRDAAAGLVYAESRGIVHRDIKPENLMRSSEGVTKIADLGLAVQVEQEAVESEAGKVLGTPHFIAPEVVRGSSADARSDLYSLGATAYRALSGRTPHQGKGTREILRSLLNEEPPGLRTIVPDLPEGVEALVHRLLAKDPENRPPTAAVVVREIDALRASGGSGAASGNSDAGGGAKKLIGVVIAAAVIGGLFLALRGGSDEPKNNGGDGASARANDGSPASTPDVGPDAGSGQASATDPPTEGDGTEIGASSVTPGGTSSPAEEDFELQALSAMLDLGDQDLAPMERARRLRTLASEFAGTDTAAAALTEASLLESSAQASVDASSALDALRKATLTKLKLASGLPTAISQDDPSLAVFNPKASLAALAAVPIPTELDADQAVQQERIALVDGVLARATARGQLVSKAADESERLGDFEATLAALRGYVRDAEWSPENLAFVESTGSKALIGFDAYFKVVRDRLDSLAGREAEFEAERLARERVQVGRALGDSFESDLRALDLGAAAARLRVAARVVTDSELSTRMDSAAESLNRGAAAIDALIDGWETPGWRRRTVLGPDGDSRVEVVGVASGALMVEVKGKPPLRTEIGAWCSSTKALQNLFLSRLDRDWSSEESQGIVVVLSLSATLRALDVLAPALQENGKRLSDGSIQKAFAAFEEAVEWADKDPVLLALAERERTAVKMLVTALRAREDGEWAHSATLISRLIDERRDTLLVMILSDGGKR